MKKKRIFFLWRKWKVMKKQFFKRKNFKNEFFLIDNICLNFRFPFSHPNFQIGKRHKSFRTRPTLNDHLNDHRPLCCTDPNCLFSRSNEWHRNFNFSNSSALSLRIVSFSFSRTFNFSHNSLLSFSAVVNFIFYSPICDLSWRFSSSNSLIFAFFSSSPAIKSSTNFFDVSNNRVNSLDFPNSGAFFVVDSSDSGFRIPLFGARFN